MRKIVVTMFLSLDGVMEEPAWTMSYWNDDIAEFKAAEMAASDALLLGRVTYEGFAEAWPSRPAEEGGDFMNGVPKYVASRSLRELHWNNSHLLGDDVPSEIDKLKRQEGKDILVYGSGTLVNSLMDTGLIDQYNLLLYPVVLGSGKRLFRDGSEAALNLVETRSFDSGVVALTYRTKGPETG